MYIEITKLAVCDLILNHADIWSKMLSEERYELLRIVENIEEDKRAMEVFYQLWHLSPF